MGGEVSNLPIVKMRNVHRTTIVASKRRKWWIKRGGRRRKRLTHTKYMYILGCVGCQDT